MASEFAWSEYGNRLVDRFVGSVTLGRGGESGFMLL